MEIKRWLKNVRVMFISLVNAPANLKKIVLKSADFDENEAGFMNIVEIKKRNDEKRVVYGLVYAPEEPDAHGDGMTEEEIEKAMELFMKQGYTRNVDKNHNYNPGVGFIRESWIVKEGDPLFKEVGAWAIGIKVEDEETWQQIKKGDITGISMAGYAEVEEIRKERWEVVPKQDLPFADLDTPWSFTARDSDEIIEKYGWQGMRKAHLVVNAEEGRYPEVKTAYKFPIAKIINGELKIVPRALFAAAAILQGARGGTNLPDDVVEKMKKVLSEYYHELDRKAPWEEKSLFRRFAEWLGIVITKSEVNEMDENKLRELIHEEIKKSLEEFGKELSELKKEVENKQEQEKPAEVEEEAEVRKTEEIFGLFENLQKEFEILKEKIEGIEKTIVSRSAGEEASNKPKSIFKGII